MLRRHTKELRSCRSISVVRFLTAFPAHGPHTVPRFMKLKQKPAFDVDAFLRSAGAGKTIATYQRTHVIFTQGDAADSVLYIQKGTVKLSVLSKSGKEAIVGMLGPGDFLGERTLTGHPVRLEAATARTATTVLIVPKQQMIRLLHDQ